MNLAFFNHQWIAFWRSKNTGRSIVVSILLGLTLLYLFGNLLIISFFLDKILEKVFSGKEAIDSFNSLLLYYFLLDLLLRFQLQELPTLNVKPYLSLPVSRNKIVNYLSITSLFTGFNLSPLLLTFPFLLKVMLTEDDVSGFLALAISITALTLFNHFFSIWFKRKITLNAWFMVGLVCVLALIILCDFYFNLISLSALSELLFNSVLSQPYLAGFTVAATILMFSINHSFTKNNLYIDEIEKNSSIKNVFTTIPFLNRFGMAGELAAIEIKLILRNKRPKSILVMSAVFMFYGLIFYNNSEPNETIMIFAGLMMTGIFIFNYGQFMFSWQSSHFDGILANNISTEDFYKSKFVLFTLFSTITLLLTIPYTYFGYKILFAHTMLYLWNIGVSSLIVLAFANHNYKYIDLSKGASFNWEGVGASQFIIGIPLFITPIVIYSLVSFFFSSVAGMLTLGFTGLIFILTRQFWIKKLIENFNSKRYTIAEGFRDH